MFMSDVNLKSYSDTSYHSKELKSLTCYRFDKVKERAKLKQSISRLVLILFPELEKMVPTLYMASVYALLSEFPGASKVSYFFSPYKADKFIGNCLQRALFQRYRYLIKTSSQNFYRLKYAC